MARGGRLIRHITSSLPNPLTDEYVPHFEVDFVDAFIGGMTLCSFEVRDEK